MATAIFGISNNGLNLVVNLLVLMLVVVWLALIVYTYLDAKRRISDPFLVGCATIASFIPYLGTAVYAIVRPPEFLEDAHERELEISAAELRVRQLAELSCPNCEYPVEKTYLRCPAASAASRTPARAAASRSTRAGRSAPTARPRCRSGSGGRGGSAGGGQSGAAPRPRRRPSRGGPRNGSRPAPNHRKGAPAVSRTLILVKPDAFERALSGEVIARFERKGLRIAALKTMVAGEEIAHEHYAEHTEKPFFGELVEFITGGTLVAMVLEGHEAVAAARQADRRHQPGRGRARLDPRRLRARGHLQHGPRLRLRRVGRARDRDLVSRAGLSRGMGGGLHLTFSVAATGVWVGSPLNFFAAKTHSARRAVRAKKYKTFRPHPHPRLVKVVLASGSPQRSEILRKLGIEFEVVVPGVEELTGGDPELEVSRTPGGRPMRSRCGLSRGWRRRGTPPRKLQLAAVGPLRRQDPRAGRLVIACDTDVVLDGRALGSRDEAEAREYLDRCRAGP